MTEIDAFGREVRAFLKRELSDEIRDAVDRSCSIFVHPSIALAWQRKLADKGWLAPMWPRAHGGAEWPSEKIVVFEIEAGLAGAPLLPAAGLSYLGPALIAYGDDAQKARFLPRILSGEDYWCQGYSEPGAGSDLAAVQCGARLEGDHYIVNGSKLWTTHAHHANRIFCLVRTSKDGKPQHGISFLLVDMDAPGVSVQPIITVAGDHEVNQVFFDDVRAPRANLVGREGQGWEIAKYILEFERGSFVMSGRMRRKLQHIRARARASGTRADSTRNAINRRLTGIEVDLCALERAERRVMARRDGGHAIGAESALLKLQLSEIMQSLDEAGMQILGPRALVDPPPAYAGGHAQSNNATPGAEIVSSYLADRAISIYGGTNEVLRGIVARHILGL